MFRRFLLCMGRLAHTVQVKVLPADETRSAVASIAGLSMLSFTFFL